MQSRSFTFLFIVVSLIFSGTMSVYATPQTYEAYQRESTNYCDGAERTWAKDKSLVPKIDYSEFTTGALNATLAKSRNNTQTSNDEKLRIKSDLDPIRIGEYSGFKALEIARVNYRTQMNSLFACGIISSRIDTLDELTKLIDAKIKVKDSNIQQSLKRESDKLKGTLNTLKCNSVNNSSASEKKVVISTIVNTASYQYCHYRHYLNYLETQTEDLLMTEKIERGIGQGEGTTLSTTTSDWVASSARYRSDISREIIQADSTLPKAIRAFIEMDQTYGAHILLILIYDDYIRLRKALSGYMNLSSQLYQKANNAQSTNK